MEPLSLIVITDTHYYSKKNWVDGNPYDFPPRRDQQYLRGSEEIIKYVFDEICKPNEPEIVLISGDLTNNGEVSSHEEMLCLLKKLKANGKNVFITTATHDYSDNGLSYGFDKNNNGVDVQALTRDNLYDYYREFSFDKALSIHMPSMSYTAQLADGYRLLALNDDHGNTEISGYSDDCFNWITEQIELAKKENQFIVAMTHHPVLAPTPIYRLISPTDILEDGDLRAKQFADMGVNFIFSGHSHVHNISSLTTDKGNKFYDISTASLVGYPPYYRYATIQPDSKKISIKSVLVDNVPELFTDNLPLSEFIKKLFLGIVEDYLYTAENDYDKFAELAIGISLKKEKAYKIKPFVQFAARKLNHLTFGKVWRFTRLQNDVKKSEIINIKDKVVVPFVIDIISNLYKGDADLDKNSVEYRLALGALKTVDMIAKPFKKKLKKVGIDSITEMALPLLHNDGIKDTDAELYFQ